jgi:integrase
MPKISKRVVDAAEVRPSDYFVWDSELRGFGLRVRASGRRTYVVQYRTRAGRTRRLTLGNADTLTPDEARQRARADLARVSEGADPSAERRAMRHTPTLNDLADRYLEQHAKLKKKPSSVRNDLTLLKLYVRPRLGPIPLADLHRADVAGFAHALRAKPVVANRALAVLSKMLNLAERWGLRPDGSNPCRHVERYRETKRERFLSEAELARLGAALAAAEQSGAEEPAVVAALRLLVFTGCRLGEVLNLRWADVDLERRALNLADSKTGARAVTLNAPALEVLAGLQRRSEWVIPGRDPSKPYVNLHKPWSRIRDAAKLEGVRVHDLRHSFAAVAAGSGHSLLVIGGLLGHTQAATTKRYAHLSDNPLRAASEAVGERIAAALTAKPAATVTPLRTGTD